MKERGICHLVECPLNINFLTKEPPAGIIVHKMNKAQGETDAK